MKTKATLFRTPRHCEGVPIIIGTTEARPTESSGRTIPFYSIEKGRSRPTAEHGSIERSDGSTLLDLTAPLIFRYVTGLSVFILLSINIAQAQNFAWKSNEIHINTKSISATTSIMPSVSWVKPRLEFTNSAEHKVEIEASVISEVPIKSILLIVGDNVSKVVRGSKPIQVSAGLTQFTVNQSITLLEGSNFIEIEVENTSGGKVSSIRSVMVGKDAITDAISSDRKDYVLLIATDKYDNWGDLVNPINDAESIAKELKERFGFEVELITNATQDEMLVKIREYSQRKFKPQDQLMIFFAGHGQFDESFGEGYVVAKNSQENDKAKSSYISHSNLRSYINNIPCEHILLTMDVCFGGTFDPVIAKSRAAEETTELTETEFLVRKLSYKTRKYITSGGKEYVSDGIPGKHSPFASRFIEALKSNGGTDRILTIGEINSYLEKIKSNEPRSGDFGDGEKGSDFVFVAKGN